MTKSEFIASIIFLNWQKISKNMFIKPGYNQIVITSANRLTITLMGKTSFNNSYYNAFKWLLANDKK